MRNGVEDYRDCVLGMDGSFGVCDWKGIGSVSVYYHHRLALPWTGITTTQARGTPAATQDDSQGSTYMLSLPDFHVGAPAKERARLSSQASPRDLRSIPKHVVLPVPPTQHSMKAVGRHKAAACKIAAKTTSRIATDVPSLKVGFHTATTSKSERLYVGKPLTYAIVDDPVCEQPQPLPFFAVLEETPGAIPAYETTPACDETGQEKSETIR
ncbi:hypothetical protein C8F04DRAFT_1262199 [Mycena alexandri]|uniref:Uncharacterized protein n=1 Tax=Mycena alexandri TaxID=1745969 RepID=A0AAD6SQI9_9AGAR|nr:hypothetical protein C8F04DRAFT_1262199 [Mycena alexandri]